MGIRVFSFFLFFPLLVYSAGMNNGRLLLAKLRGGDYAHAGDQAAVDLVAAKAQKLSPKAQKGPCLDVGSGFGGTAGYLSHCGFQSIYGIDLDEAAVHYAREKYPQAHFLAADAFKVAELFEEEFFSFIYLFNVLYSIEDKTTLLQKLFSVAKPGALLVLFDYTSEKPVLGMQDLAGKPMYPIVTTQLLEACKATGWEILEITDLSSSFLFWYEDLLHKLEKEREMLSLSFSETDITRVQTTFSSLLHQLKNGQICGGVFYLKRITSSTEVLTLQDQ